MPGVVRSVKAPDGGADMESTMRSCGDTVCRFGICAGAGSLMGSKWGSKSMDGSKRSSLASGAEVKSLLWVVKPNMLSEETSEMVTVSSGSELEEPSGEEEVPS